MTLEVTSKLQPSRLDRSFAFCAVLILATLIFALPSQASMSAVYLAQTAQGGGTGADCADARAVSFFNSSGNWGSGSTQIGPGTTVHLCGTFTAPAGSSGYLTVQGSGNSTSPVTLLFEAGAVLTAPYWGAEGAISNDGNNYITVNGGTNGTIQATANGTSLANQQAGNFIYFYGVSNSEITNVTMVNQYVHTSSTSDGADGTGQGCIRWAYGSNVHIDHNTCHDAGYGLLFAYQSSSNIEIDHNTVYNVNWGLIVGDGSGSSVLSAPVLIHDNDVHDFALWDNSNDVNHHDGIYCFATNSGSSLNACSIYNNYVHGDPGLYMNTYIFLSEYGGGDSCGGLFLFNNVLVNTGAAGHVPANGMIEDWCNTDTLVNNTLIQNGVTQNPLGPLSMAFRPNVGTNLKFENNIASTAYIGVAIDGSITTSDYNDYYNLSYVGWDGSNNGFTSVSAWQGCHANGCPTGTHDTHSSGANPNLSSSYALQSGSAAIGLGTNLTSLGITALDTGAPQTFGATGSCGSGCLARPTSGAWDAGAYQYSTQSGSAPNPPTGLTATVN